MTFFQGGSAIIIYLLILSPLMPASCLVFASLIYEDECNTQALTFKTTIANTAKPLQLI